jgi:hypothetical protein
MIGSEWLTTVSKTYPGPPATIPPPWEIGDRIAVAPVAPDSLGGRLALAAKAYQMHKAIKLRVRYAPSVPATVSGSLAIYYHNDDSLQTGLTGTLHVRTAATNTAFIQTQIWEEAFLDIPIKDALKEYYDDESNQVRFSVQGQIIVVATSAIELDSEATATVNYGTIYLDYVYDFMEPSLSTNVSLVADHVTLGITEPTATITTTRVVRTKFNSAAVATDYTSVLTSLGGIALAELPDYMGVWCLEFSDSDIQWIEAPGSSISENYNLHGAAVYCRWFTVEDTSTTNTYMIMFGDLESASNFVIATSGAFESITPGEIVYGNPGFSLFGFATSGKMRLWPMATDL